jgi:hypothetical protein
MQEKERNDRNRSWGLLAGLLAFLYFTGLTIAYFVVHKPF